MLGHMCQGLAFTAYVAALPQLARALGAHGELIAQLTLSTAALGTMIGALGSGWVLQKLGTRLTMMIGMAVFGLAGAAGAVVRNSALLLGSRFFVGAASVCMVTACVWMIGAQYSGDRRAKVIGAATAFGSFASLVGIVIGGYLTQYLGWPAAFLQYPALALAGLALVLSCVRQVRPEHLGTKKAPPFFAQLFPLYLLACVISTVMFMGSTQFAFLLEGNGVTNAATRSLIMGAITVMATLTSFSYGTVQRALGTQGALILALACITLSLTAIGMGTTPVTAALGAGFMGSYVGITMPYLNHVVTERSEASVRNHAIGMLNSFMFLGAFLNPLIFVPWSRLIGLRHVFVSVAALTLALAVGAILQLRRMRRSAAQGLAT
ncbi:MAG: MFS transporter [Steroidobacteraceae bacterium]